MYTVYLQFLPKISEHDILPIILTIMGNVCRPTWTVVFLNVQMSYWVTSLHSFLLRIHVPGGLPCTPYYFCL